MSWFQETPAPSLEMIRTAGLGPASSVLDVGGGASRLVGALLLDGYRVGVLDVAPGPWRWRGPGSASGPPV